MKNHVLFFLFSFISLSFWTCMGSTAFIHEQDLLPKTGEDEKWWLVTVISQNKNKQAIHLSALFQQSLNGKQESIALFTALWAEDEKAYFSNVSVSNNVMVSKNQKFPLELELTSKDSSALKLYGALSRKKLWLQSVVQQKNTNDFFSLFAQLKFKKNRPFNIIKDNSNITNLYSIPPVKSFLKLDSKNKYRDSALFSLHVFGNGKNLLTKTKDNYVALMDLFLEDGSFCSFIIETKADGNTHLLNAMYQGRDSRANTTIDIACRAMKENIWHSSNTNKNYFLNYLIEIPQLGLQLETLPKADNQELGIGQNAFWMGAIAIKDSKSGLPFGAGNMIVLKR